MNRKEKKAVLEVCFIGFLFGIIFGTIRYFSQTAFVVILIIAAIALLLFNVFGNGAPKLKGNFSGKALLMCVVAFLFGALGITAALTTAF
jgi:hypothetical protein